VRRLVPILGALLLITDGAVAAVKPAAIATSGSGGTASVSAGTYDRWRIVVTTKPRGLSVLLTIRGQRRQVVEGPWSRTEFCPRSCRVEATARLWEANGTAPSGTVTLALYKLVHA